MGKAMTTAERDQKSPEPLDSRWPALMNQKTAARYLGVSVDKLQEAIHMGYIAPVMWGKQKLYRRADLDEFLMELDYAD